MVGLDESRAMPHAAIVSDCDHIRNTARKLVINHGILEGVGWNRKAFVGLNAGVRRPMESHSKESPKQTDLETPLNSTDIITTDQLWIACSADRVWISPNALSLVIGGPHVKPRLASMGGLLQVENELWAITVAHVFQQEPPCDDHDNDMFDFDESDLAVLMSTDITTTEEMEFAPLSISSESFQQGMDTLELGKTRQRAPGLTSGDLFTASTEESEQSSSPKVKLGQPGLSNALIGTPGIAKLVSTHIRDGDIMANPALDYSMIKINHTNWQSNILSYKGLDGSIVVKEISTVADCMIPNGERLYLLTGSSGAVIGTSIESSSILCLSESKENLQVWTVSLGAVRKGDCGSWAIGIKTGELLGMLIATCPALNEAYILPGQRIMADIKSKLSTVNVSLPLNPLAKFEAAMYIGAAEEIDVHISGGISLAPSSGERTSPLYYAASSGDLEAVKWLINEGADPNKGYVRITKGVINKAVESGKPEILRKLLEVQRDVTERMELITLTPLYAAIKGHYVDIVDILTKEGVDMDRAAFSYITYPLTIALKKGAEEIFQLLLDAGHDTSVTDQGAHQSAEEVEKLFPDEAIHALLEAARATAQAVKTEKEKETESKHKAEISPDD